jgi:hypothetical protein
VSNLGIAMLLFQIAPRELVVQLSFDGVAFSGLLHRRCSLDNVRRLGRRHIRGNVKKQRRNGGCHHW